MWKHYSNCCWHVRLYSSAPVFLSPMANKFITTIELWVLGVQQQDWSTQTCPKAIVLNSMQTQMKGVQQLPLCGAESLNHPQLPLQNKDNLLVRNPNLTNTSTNQWPLSVVSMLHLHGLLKIWAIGRKKTVLKQCWVVLWIFLKNCRFLFCKCSRFKESPVPVPWKTSESKKSWFRLFQKS